MSSSRTNVLLSMLKGLLICTLSTLAGMLMIALLTVFTRISDETLLALNQILKTISIILGTLASVGFGGSRGFVTGATVALLYMVVGYVMYVSLGGEPSTVTMLGEMLMGATIGAITGAILANLRPHKRRR